MIENVWCVLCKDILEDSRTKSITYVNCFDEMVTKKLPGNAPPFGIGSVWRRTSEEQEVLKVKIRSLDPSGKEKVLFESNAIEMKAKNHRLNLLMGGLPISQEGIYKFIVEFFNGESWVFVKELQFNVKVEK